MKYTTGFLAATLASAVFALALFSTVNAQTKPKYTTKQIMKDLNLPVYFIGVGEQAQDLVPFDLESYIKGLIITEKESINEE